MALSLWPWRRRDDSRSKDKQPPAELRIATSGSFSIRASVESLRVDGAGSYSQAGRVRAALFVPSTCTTVLFHGDNVRRASSSARSSSLHVLRMLTEEQTASVLTDAKRIGDAIGWSDRGVSLPTQDILVQNLSKESQDLVHTAIRETLLPFARRQYPHLNAAFDKQPYPRPGNLFIVRYSTLVAGRAGGRGLKMHKDETALTFNLCLTPQEGFEGGGTYFPATSSDVDGILLRPTPGFCLVHDGNLKHAGNDVTSGERFILVGFYNADGRDRAGEEQFFSKAALEEARKELLQKPLPPIQTIYFTTAVAATRPSSSADADVGAADGATPSALYARPSSDGAPPVPTGGSSSSSSALFGQSERRLLSSVAVRGSVPIGEEAVVTERSDRRRGFGAVKGDCTGEPPGHAEGWGRTPTLGSAGMVGTLPSGATSPTDSLSGRSSHRSSSSSAAPLSADRGHRGLGAASAVGEVARNGPRIDVPCTPSTADMQKGQPTTSQPDPARPWLSQPPSQQQSLQQQQQQQQQQQGGEEEGRSSAQGTADGSPSSARGGLRLPSSGPPLPPVNGRSSGSLQRETSATAAPPAAPAASRPPVRASSPLSCMPGWPLLQLLQGKPGRPRQ
eukprot:CAMPEP_0115852198 /NCGR_PEP_ID=MMETSP0287-20121206/12872_1 /TAXON_ID=412157 /ORGANISM="Chrysochromulina rotalis, Strain UIO044" /LENGTH=619 /DNA_ID=CAMNT_0003306251 /DNA_START=123 /DNA_END=1982 /DNA_ORIENTATION=-